MQPANSLVHIRRKRMSDSAMLWFAQVLIAFFRVVFRALELVGPKKQRPRLRQLREKMDAINHERDALVSQIKGGNVLGGIESLEERLGRYSSPKDRAGLQETVESVRATRQEAEALRSITLQAGEDRAMAVAGYRAYVHSHTDSPAGFSWLGGALRKAGDLTGSIAAYREAIRLAGATSISGTSARLQLGMVLEAMGEIEAAIAGFRRIITDASPPTETFVCLAYLSLGNALNTQGNRSEARAAWKQVIKWDRTKIAAKQARELLAANR